MVEPIKPDEVHHPISDSIPEGVIEVFNKMIAEKWNGRHALLYQDDILAVVADKLGVSDSHIYKEHWLDVEELYRKEGWIVVYNKPTYADEPFRAYFQFRRPKKKEK